METVREHIKRVGKRLTNIALLLIDRATYHDASKLQEPERLGWEMMDQEPRYPYGSAEYFEKMKKYRAIFEHHYAVNSHHPEHYEDGIYGMDLVDLIEMLCDWFSYKECFTVEEGHKIVREQCKRFNIDPNLQKILLNSFNHYIVEESSLELDMAEIERKCADAKLYYFLERLGYLKGNSFGEFEKTLYENQQKIIDNIADC